MIEGFIYDAFAGKCKANYFKISEVIIAGVAECDALIDIAKAKREKITREAMGAQILRAALILRSSHHQYLPNTNPAH